MNERKTCTECGRESDDWLEQVYEPGKRRIVCWPCASRLVKESSLVYREPCAECQQLVDDWCEVVGENAPERILCWQCAEEHATRCDSCGEWFEDGLVRRVARPNGENEDLADDLCEACDEAIEEDRWQEVLRHRIP